MIVVYIHGFCSSAKANKAQILNRVIQSEYEDITFVSADFSDSFALAIKQLRALCKDLLKKDSSLCLVGSSLGGFISLALSSEFSLKTALVNPCLNPSFFLAKYDYLGRELENYDTGDRFVISGEDISLMNSLEEKLMRYDSSLVSVFLQKGDEVLDYTHSLSFFEKYGAAIVDVQDGGSHRYENFEKTVTKIIEFFRSADKVSKNRPRKGTTAKS
ncbi:MAG: YqiA/YcfP family alpha/beta fold hydrolase [Succinivibrio sp.]